MTTKALSVQERIIHAIRKGIYSGDLKPGDALLEMQLARQHGVSQTTVREALTKLEHAGLVRRIRNQGTFVTELSHQELREHLRLRVVLEGMAAVDAASRMSAEDYAELQLLLDRFLKAVSQNAYYESSQTDLEIHRFIWTRSGDGTLCRLLEQVAAPLFAFFSIRHSAERESLQRVLYQQHQPIIEALRAGSPETIREAIRVHIESSYKRYLAMGMEALQVSIE